jgi:AraC-like DNA-binding protein
MDAAGVAAKEYIDRRVLLEAKRLLVHGDQPAAKIAARLGFSSATNFSKFFRQRAGTSPLAADAERRRHPAQAPTPQHDEPELAPHGGIDRCRNIVRYSWRWTSVLTAAPMA